MLGLLQFTSLQMKFAWLNIKPFSLAPCTASGCCRALVSSPCKHGDSSVCAPASEQLFEFLHKERKRERKRQYSPRAHCIAKLYWLWNNWQKTEMAADENTFLLPHHWAWAHEGLVRHPSRNQTARDWKSFSPCCLQFLCLQEEDQIQTQVHLLPEHEITLTTLKCCGIK